VCVVLSKNTPTNSTEKEKKRILRQRRKKILFRVLGFFKKKGREKERSRTIKNTSTATTKQKRINTSNVGWNALRAPSHAEGMKAALSFLFFLSFFLSDVFVFFLQTRDVGFSQQINVFRRRLVKYRSALTSLSNLSSFQNDDDDDDISHITYIKLLL